MTVQSTVNNKKKTQTWFKPEINKASKIAISKEEKATATRSLTWRL